MPPPGRRRIPAAKDGAEVPISSSVEDQTPTDLGRRRSRIVGRYEDFLRSTVDWIWETDAELVLTYVSSPVALKLGIPAQALIGRPLLGIGQFERAQEKGEDRPAPLSDRRPFRNALFVMTGAEGREVPYRFSGIPCYHDETGKFEGYRGTAVAAPTRPAPASEKDEQLTVLAGRLEEALLRNHDLNWRLLQADRRKDTGLPVPSGKLEQAAHELRTPLTAIVGYADLALKGMFGPLGERYVECFRTIREAGRHLDELISQMQEAGNQAKLPFLQSEVVNIADVVARARAIVALAAREAEVDVSRVGPMAGGRAIGDHLACTQILVNLLTNAVKFTSAGGSIGLETLIGSDHKLHVVVWDTGVGISPKDRERIFEPDYRVVQATAVSNTPGLGLGLPIARDLARAMGGDLSLTSQPGQGSRFTLSLPLAESSSPKDD